MKRIAIVGANGQVGVEVCLRLRHAADIEVVPIARNVSGSAFLRRNGMECRHGRIVDPDDARRLIGDCDAVVDFALSTTGIPRVDRDINRKVLRGIVAGAKPAAPIVFASTIMVYAPGMRFRFPDSYGMEKLSAERLLVRLCRSSHHPLFVCRLGHVLGEMQNITRQIRSELRQGDVALPQQGLIASNSVFTVTIVEAILQIARGQQAPGVYDLVSSPQWTWKEVYQHYAAQLGVPFYLAPSDGMNSSDHNSRGWLRKLLGHLRTNQWLRERLMFFLAYLPRELNQRIYLQYLQARARAEINALRKRKEPTSSVFAWRELKIRPVPNLPDPVTLEARYPLENTIDYSGAEFRRTLPHPSR